MRILKQDPKRSTSHFLIGIALIAATILTGILPGLLIMGIIYGATGRHVGEFFQPHKTKLQEDLKRLKAEFDAEESKSALSSWPSAPQLS